MAERGRCSLPCSPIDTVLSLGQLSPRYYALSCLNVDLVVGNVIR
jgi:hypothetical protein